MPKPTVSTSATGLRASVFSDLAPRLRARKAAGQPLIALHLGDTHLAPPEPAASALWASAREPSPTLFQYGALGGLADLRQAIAEQAVATFRRENVNPDSEVLLGCGATHALFCAARALFDPGDEVLVAAPYWPLSVGVLGAAGARIVEAPLTGVLYAHPSTSVASLLEPFITPRTKALYFASPNNPDGKVLSQSQLEEIAALALRHGLWVLSDEVYADYAYDGPHRSIGTLPGMAERTLSAFSLSKSHGLAGLRLGYILGPESVVSLAQRVVTHTVFNVPVLLQRAAVSALRDGLPWIQTARSHYLHARDSTVAALRGTRARFHVPEGGSYVFVDFSELLDGRPLRAFLERAIDHGVLLAPGDGFGGAFPTWARLCFTSVPPKELTEGLLRLRDAMDAFASA